MNKMTKQEEYELRTHSAMSLFNFMLDDITKLKTIKKLKSLGLTSQKGEIAATIRVLLNNFAEDKIQIDPKEIEKEYIFTTKKNKRSNL